MKPHTDGFVTQDAADEETQRAAQSPSPPFEMEERAGERRCPAWMRPFARLDQPSPRSYLTGRGSRSRGRLVHLGIPLLHSEWRRGPGRGGVPHGRDRPQGCRPCWDLVASTIADPELKCWAIFGRPCGIRPRVTDLSLPDTPIPCRELLNHGCYPTCLRRQPWLGHQRHHRFSLLHPLPDLLDLQAISE